VIYTLARIADLWSRLGCVQNNPVNLNALESVHGSSKGVQEYRLRVCATLPWLRELDFSTVTSSERAGARNHREESRRVRETGTEC